MILLLAIAAPVPGLSAGTGDFAAISAPGQDELLSQDLASFLARRGERVEAYVSWTYGWATSYANSYQSVFRIALSLWKNPESWKVNVSDVLRDLQNQAIRSRITHPEEDAAALSALIDRHAEGRVYLLSSLSAAGLCGRSPEADCRGRALAQLQPLSERIRAARQDPLARAREHQQLARLLSFPESGPVDFLHAARPVTTRLVALVIRLTEITSIVLLVSAGLRRLYVPDSSITRILVAFGIAWGLDYALLATERLVNEESLRASLEAQLSSQEPVLAEYVTSRMRAAETEFMNGVKSLDGGPDSWRLQR